MANKYYIGMDYGNANTAASKAPADVETILERLGYSAVMIHKLYPNELLEKLHIDVVRKYLISDNDWKSVVRKIEKNSKVVLQYPCQTPQIVAKYVDYLQNQKQCDVIAVIHDLETLRMGVYKDSYKESRSTFGDHVLLKKCKYVICHNDKMKQHLISVGFEEQRLISLGIFDYLIENEEQLPIHEYDQTAIIAGNMSPEKSGYIYKLHEACPNMKIHLYGPHFDEHRISNRDIYKGQVSPEKLPFVIEGSIGIVWDGAEITACVGNTGNYLKYNNPHKASSYLAAGIPIAIWKEAALATFVAENGVGIVVEHLSDLENELNKLTKDEYNEMRKNVVSVANRIRNGKYLEKALGLCQ